MKSKLFVILFGQKCIQIRPWPTYCGWKGDARPCCGNRPCLGGQCSTRVSNPKYLYVFICKGRIRHPIRPYYPDIDIDPPDMDNRVGVGKAGLRICRTREQSLFFFVLNILNKVT